MPAAQTGDETSVHQARVASRRLRQAIPLLGVRADAAAVDRAGRRVRRITRALGPVRELDVTLLLLAELERKGAAPARAIARVRTAVTEERQERRREMLAAIKPSKLNKLRKQLVQVAAPESDTTETRSALAEANAQAAARAAQLRAAIEHAGGIYLADRLHRIRIAAKKLRYALEIQREAVGGLAVLRRRELEHFALQRVGQAVDAHDAVLQRHDRAGVARLGDRLEILDAALDQVADFGRVKLLHDESLRKIPRR